MVDKKESMTELNISITLQLDNNGKGVIVTYFQSASWGRSKKGRAYPRRVRIAQLVKPPSLYNRSPRLSVSAM